MRRFAVALWSSGARRNIEPIVNHVLPKALCACSTPRHTAAHCGTLRHTAAHCSTPRHTAAHCGTLRHTQLQRPPNPLQLSSALCEPHPPLRHPGQPQARAPSLRLVPGGVHQGPPEGCARRRRRGGRRAQAPAAQGALARVAALARVGERPGLGAPRPCSAPALQPLCARMRAHACAHMHAGEGMHAGRQAGG